MNPTPYELYSAYGIHLQPETSLTYDLGGELSFLKIFRIYIWVFLKLK